MKKNKTLVLCVVGIMSAMSTVIYLLFPEIPLVPGVEYLKIDFSDIPAVITALVVNPFAGVLVEAIKNAIHLFRTTTFGIGELMNTGIGAAMILTLTAFLKLFSKKLKKGLLSPLGYFLSAAISLAATILAGWLLNAALTPVFFALMGIMGLPSMVKYLVDLGWLVLLLLLLKYGMQSKMKQVQKKHFQLLF